MWDIPLYHTGAESGKSWEVPDKFRILDACREWGITYMDFIDQPQEHQAEMLGYMDVRARMRAVEQDEHEIERKQKEFEGKMLKGRR